MSKAQRKKGVEAESQHCTGEEFTGGWFRFWLINCFAYHHYSYSLLLRCIWV